MHYLPMSGRWLMRYRRSVFDAARNHAAAGASHSLAVASERFDMTLVNVDGWSRQMIGDDLQSAMPDKVSLPGDDTYRRAREIWNGAVDRHPALFVHCETSADVQAAVRAARAHRLPLSIRGGGHDWAGRALCDDGLVIDLSAMRRVEVDATTRTATVAGGARAIDVANAATGHGLAAVTGNCGTVGMAGLTLGGGYGPLSPRHGLALDNLLAADVVLADGRCVVADPINHPDLFWALRGGGGNFGVVTSMRIRLHPIRHVLAGLILFPWSDAVTVFGRYAELMAAAPDELAVTAGILSAQDGSAVLFLAPCWSGPPNQGEQYMTTLLGLGTPVLAQIGLMTGSELISMFDAHVVSGRHYAIQTRWLAELTPDVIAWLIAAGSERTSPFSAIVLHHFHGIGTRRVANATAFGLRQEHYLVEIIAAWDPDRQVDDAIHRQWAQSLSQVLAPFALPGGYPNLLGPDQHEQIEHAYGGNALRLLRMKRRFDPEGIFASAIALPAEGERHQGVTRSGAVGL